MIMILYVLCDVFVYFYFATGVQRLRKISRGGIPNSAVLRYRVLALVTTRGELKKTQVKIGQ
jgi:hypothetical protein